MMKHAPFKRTNKILGHILLGNLVVALMSGCATPNRAKLTEFSTLTLQDSAVQETPQFCVEAARVGASCLKEMFRTSKINKQFTVYWLSVTAKENGIIEFDRNRIALNAAGSKNYPVGPGRVAYLSRSSSTAMLIAAVAVPVLVPIAAPVAVNVTGVAATAHVAGTQASNVQRTQETRLGSLPDTATLQPGETLAGFVFFEVPGEGNGTSMIEGEFVVGEQATAFSITNIPEVNPKFGKEKKNDKKK